LRYTDKDQNYVALLLDPKALSSTCTGNSVDRRHYEAAHIIIPMDVSTTGLASANYVIFTLTHCSASDGTFTVVDQYITPGQMQAFSGTTGLSFAAVSGTATTSQVLEATVDLKACKRYISVSAIVVGSTAVYETGVIAVLGDTYAYPVD
jgi:hypothetical protein